MTLRMPKNCKIIKGDGTVVGVIGAEHYRRRSVVAKRAAYHEIGHVIAAITYGIPIISVSINTATPHMHRGNYHPPPGIGLEAMVTLCLAGPAAETFYVGPITDGSDETDYRMAREYLSRRYDTLEIGVQLNRMRDAADKLVRTQWARDRIERISAALLARGTLTSEDVAALVS